MIIGICGLIGSGKDTAAQYLVDSRGYVRVSFADTLKDATAVVFGWDREMLEGRTAETRLQREILDPFWTEKLGRDWSPRIALQYLGTELFRDNLHKDIWVIAAEKKILDIFEKSKDVVISDCRFPNEIDMIKRLGGDVWWVKRGELPEWWAKASLVYPANEIIMQKYYPGVHFSEWAWANADFDSVFTNDGTLADLYNKIESTIQVEEGEE